MHLQDAYFAEKSEVGTGDQIAYTAPPNNVFTYNVATAGTFSAKNAKALDKCSANGEWKVVGVGGSKTVSYTSTVTGANCDVLTPNFSTIGKGS